MSATEQEHATSERLSERPSIDASRARRADPRGATAGALALTTFAIVFTLVSAHAPGGIALLAATVPWAVVAHGLYVLFWWR